MEVLEGSKELGEEEEEAEEVEVCEIAALYLCEGQAEPTIHVSGRALHSCEIMLSFKETSSILYISFRGVQFGGTYAKIGMRISGLHRDIRSKNEDLNGVLVQYDVLSGDVYVIKKLIGASGVAA